MVRLFFTLFTCAGRNFFLVSDLAGKFVRYPTTSAAGDERHGQEAKAVIALNTAVGHRTEEDELESITAVLVHMNKAHLHRSLR